MTTALTADTLAERVDRLAAEVPALTRALWDDVSARTSAVDGVAELLTAARDADGGKYVRPRLVAASFFAHGGHDTETARAAAAAVQVLHVGLCLHDDVIDGDRVRHGRPTVAAAVEAAAHARGVAPALSERRGAAAGILAGDFAIAAAIGALLAAPASADVRVRLAETATAALEQTIAGEVLDVWSEAEAPLDVRPLAIAARKTAAYSIVLPLRLGAVAAGAGDSIHLHDIAAVGEPLGIAYQLADDELGLFGDPARTGKARLSDLRDGKRTELMRVTLERAAPDEAATVRAALGDPGLTETQAARVRAIVESTGARAEVSRTIDALVDEAMHAARDVLPGPLADHLCALARRLRGRES